MKIMDVMQGVMMGRYKNNDVFQVEGHEAILTICGPGICIMGTDNLNGATISRGVMTGYINLKYLGNFNKEKLETRFGHLQLGGGTNVIIE